MMSKQFAKQFIKEYDIQNLTQDKLTDIIDKLGFQIIKFNTIYNDEKVQSLITNLNLESDIQNKKCFTYKCESIKLIFILDSLNEQESIAVLLHEIGHIYMEHFKFINESSDVKYEEEANLFSFWVKKYVTAKNEIKKISKLLLFSLGITTLISALILIVLSIHNSLGKDDYDLKTDWNTITSTATSNEVTSVSTIPTDDTPTQSAKTTTAPHTSTSDTTLTTIPNTISPDVNFPLDINTVTLEELLLIPGIGETTAQKIIDFRNQNGTITNFNSLLQIDGIGEGRLNLLKKYLYITENIIIESSNMEFTTTNTHSKSAVSSSFISTEKSQLETQQSVALTTIKQMKSVNINTASAEEISDSLLIDLSLAQSITDLRDKIGHYSNFLELLYVDGISQKWLAEVQDYIEL